MPSLRRDISFSIRFIADGVFSMIYDAFVPETTEGLKRRIDELEHQVWLYGQLLDAVPEMVLCKGPESRIVYANKAFRDYYGMDQKALQGLIDAPFNEPDYTQQYIKDDAHVFMTGQTLDIPSEPVTRYDGEVRLFHTVKSAVRNAEGNVIYTVGISHDITTEKARSARLRLLEALAEHAPDGIALATLEGEVTYANPAFGMLFGYGLQTVGMHIPDFSPASEQEQLGEVVQAVQELGYWQGVLTYQRADRTTFRGAITVFLVRDEQGAGIAFGGIFRDVTTEQVQAEQLRQFQALVEHAPDAVGLAHFDGHIFYANDAFRRLSGYGDAVVGMNFAQLYLPEEQSVVVAADQQVMAQGFWNGTIRWALPGGQVQPMRATVFLIRDADDQPQSLATIMQDISAQLRAEEEKLALQEEVIQAQQVALRELSTPLIPLAQQLIAMPLIGTIDSRRTLHIVETLLHGVNAYQARTVIIDITGVPLVDSHVANTILHAAQAVKLLGAQAILTGIRPEVAQTLVGLGVELKGIVTRRTLQDGIAYALR
jgi:rsbT co-antagonist protein RsbR